MLRHLQCCLLYLRLQRRNVGLFLLRETFGTQIVARGKEVVVAAGLEVQEVLGGGFRAVHSFLIVRIKLRTQRTLHLEHLPEDLSLSALPRPYSVLIITRCSLKRSQIIHLVLFYLCLSMFLKNLIPVEVQIVHRREK